MAVHIQTKMKTFFALLCSLSMFLEHNKVFAKYSISDLKVGTDPSYTIRIVPIVKNVDSIIDITGTPYILQDLGNNNKFAVKIDRINPKTNTAKPMANMKGKGVCDAINTYLGADFHEVERIASVPNPGACPIVKGNYTLKNSYQLDLGKLPILTVIPNSIYLLALRMLASDGKKVLGTLSFKFNKNV